MATTKTAVKTTGKRKDPKFRVHPKLSITGKDLMSRIKNRSIILEDNGQYTLDETMHEATMLSKPEIVNKAIRNNERIQQIKARIESNEQLKTKEARERIKKDLEELEQLRKQANQSKP